MTDLKAFQFSVPIQIRYGDLDVLAHVNNVMYFSYMETARLEYARQILGWDGKRGNLGVIVAKATCDFLLPLVYGDAIRVFVRASRLGNKSFDYEYAIVRDSDQAIVATGLSVQVCYDYTTDSSIPLPEEWRQKMLVVP
jgi:acyl-CoA thioester hydrolase